MLTTDEFWSVLSALKTDGFKGGERRASPRVSTRGVVDTVPVLASDARPAVQSIRVRDISRGGIGLLSSTSIKTTTRLLVRIPAGKNSEQLVVLCEVARCESVAGGLHVIGCRFVQRLTALEFDQLVAGNAEVITRLAA